MNRLGYCVDYHVVERMATDLAQNIEDKRRATPDNLLQMFGHGMASNNYHEIPETLSGSDSLHETVGICYQNEILNGEEVITQADVPESPETLNKLANRQRIFVPKRQSHCTIST